MYSEEQAKQLTQEFDIEGKRIAIHVSNFSKIKNVSFLVCVLKRLISLTNDYKFILWEMDQQKGRRTFSE